MMPIQANRLTPQSQLSNPGLKLGIPILPSLLFQLMLLLFFLPLVRVGPGISPLRLRGGPLWPM